MSGLLNVICAIWRAEDLWESELSSPHGSVRWTSFSGSTHPGLC